VLLLVAGSIRRRRGRPGKKRQKIDSAGGASAFEEMRKGKRRQGVGTIGGYRYHGGAGRERAYPSEERGASKFNEIGWGMGEKKGKLGNSGASSVN